MTKEDFNIGDEVVVNPEQKSCIVEEVFEDGFFGMDKSGDSQEYSFDHVLALFPKSYKERHGF